MTSLQTTSNFAHFSSAVDQLHLIANHLPMELGFEGDQLTAQKKELREKIWQVFSDIALVVAHYLSAGYVANPLVAHKAHLEKIITVIKSSSKTINTEWKHVFSLLKADEVDQIMTKIDALWNFYNWTILITDNRWDGEYAIFNKPVGYSDVLLRLLNQSVTFTSDDQRSMLHSAVLSVVCDAHAYRSPNTGNPMLEPWFMPGRQENRVKIAILEMGCVDDAKIGHDGGYPLLVDRIIDRGPKVRLTYLISAACAAVGHYDQDCRTLKAPLYRQLDRHEALIQSDTEFATLVSKFKDKFDTIEG